MDENNSTNKKQQKTGPEEEPMLPIPPLDFSALVLPFFSQALVSLEKVENEPPERKDHHLELAKRLIDLLDLLKQRTKGNLKPEEEKFLEASLSRLKLSYMEKARIIKL
ncbi:MAG: DUF1844 domain-containing protein [Candidatus Aminicenantales bacterium]